jgi:hypothetical protein
VPPAPGEPGAARLRRPAQDGDVATPTLAVAKLPALTAVGSAHSFVSETDSARALKPGDKLPRARAASDLAVGITESDALRSREAIAAEIHVKARSARPPLLVAGRRRKLRREDGSPGQCFISAAASAIASSCRALQETDGPRRFVRAQE